MSYFIEIQVQAHLVFLEEVLDLADVFWEVGIEIKIPINYFFAPEKCEYTSECEERTEGDCLAKLLFTDKKQCDPKYCTGEKSKHYCGD